MVGIAISGGCYIGHLGLHHLIFLFGNQSIDSKKLLSTLTTKDQVYNFNIRSNCNKIAVYLNVVVRFPSGHRSMSTSITQGLIFCSHLFGYSVL